MSDRIPIRDTIHDAEYLLRAKVDLQFAEWTQQNRGQLPVLGICRTATSGLGALAMDHFPTPDEADEITAIFGSHVELYVVRPATFEVLSHRVEVAIVDSLSLEQGLDLIVRDAVRAGASDIHLVGGQPPWLRVGASFAPMRNYGPLTSDEIRELCAPYFDTDLVLQSDGDTEADLAFNCLSRRIRTNIAHVRDATGIASAIKVSMRILPTTPPWARDLGLPPILLRWAEAPRGIILITGPVGSGKTTTLAALIDHINRTREGGGKILTIEDPVEYIHPPRRCLVTHREIGVDAPSFAEALRRGLRQDANIIMVGEMRDRATMETAITAAETGHLVLSTLHAFGGSAVVDRITASFPEGERAQIRTQLAMTLIGVCSQDLLPDAHDPARRHLVCEIMVNTPAIGNLIRQGESLRIDSQMQNGVLSDGQQPYDLGLALAVSDGLISAETAAAKAYNPDVFRSYLQDLQRRAS
jgi:twitching motility protein PilT